MSAVDSNQNTELEDSMYSGVFKQMKAKDERIKELEEALKLTLNDADSEDNATMLSVGTRARIENRLK